MDGSLPAGTHLVQGELASQLEVSVTPIREALRDLATEGLVVFDPHRGALVRRFDLAEVREVYELRSALEPLMVRRGMAAIRPEQLERADELRGRMEKTTDLAQWAELNRQFHAALTEPDSNSRLSTILSGLRDSASAYVGMSLSASPERVAESNEEHAALLELYRRRDVEGAIRLTVQHLKTTLDLIEQAHKQGLL